MSSLETLLDGEDEVAEVEPVAEVAETEVTTEEPTGDKETETEVTTEDEVKTDSSPEPDKDTEQNPELNGVHKELSRIRKLNRQLNEDLQATKETPKLTSVFENEDQFAADIDNRINTQVVAVELRISEKYARRAHGDEIVDSAINWFDKTARESPLLLKRFHDSGNDVDEIVDLYNKNLKAEKLDDLPAYEAELEAKITARVEKRIADASAAKAELKDSIPTSLVGEDSKGSLTSSDWSGPTSLESLID